MPESQIEFRVDAPIEKVWNAMSDPKMHTHCIPGLISCQVLGPNTNLWVMEFQFGPLIKKVEMESTTVKVVPPHLGIWVGKARGIEMSGEVELKQNSNSCTDVHYKLRLEPKSIFLLSMLSFIEEKLEQDVRQYARNIKNQVENKNDNN